MKIAIILTLLLVLAGAAFGQYTSVTAVVQDANGNLYQNCRYSVDFVYPVGGTGLPVISGTNTQFQTSYSGASCDSSANLAIRLVANTSISPANSQWRFSICSVNGQTCFTYTGTITGASLSLTAALQAVSAPLPQGANNATSIQGKGVQNPLTAGMLLTIDPTSTKVVGQQPGMIDVRSCGAVFAGASCDNVANTGCTDSGAAIQACMNTTQGSTLMFPAQRTNTATQTCDYFSSVMLVPIGDIVGVGGRQANSNTKANGVTICFPSNVTGMQVNNAVTGCSGCSIRNIALIGGDPSGTATANPATFIVPTAEKMPHFMRRINTIQRAGNVLTVSVFGETQNATSDGQEGLTQQVGSIVKINGVTNDATMNGTCIVASLSAGTGTTNNPKTFTCAQNGANSGPFSFTSFNTYVSLATTGAASSDGIQICSNFTSLQNVQVQGFARWGILGDGNALSTGTGERFSANNRYSNCGSNSWADDVVLNHVSVWNSFAGIGFFGSNGQAGEFMGNSTVYNTWGAGIEDESDVGNYIHGNQVTNTGGVKITDARTVGSVGLVATAINTISRVSGLVDVTLSATPAVAYKQGNCVVIAGVTDASFNTPAGVLGTTNPGTCYFLTSIISPTHFQYIQPGAPVDAASNGGTLIFGALAQVALSSGADYNATNPVQYKIGAQSVIYSNEFVGNYQEGGGNKMSQSTGFLNLPGPGAGWPAAINSDWIPNYVNGAETNIVRFGNHKTSAFQQFFQTGVSAADGFEYDRLITDNNRTNTYWKESFNNAGGNGAPSGLYTLARGYDTKFRLLFSGPSNGNGVTRIYSESTGAVEINNGTGFGTGGLVVCNGVTAGVCPASISGTGLGTFNGGVTTAAITGTAITGATYSTTTNCSGVGTAANPSVVTCGSAASGAVACSVSASGGTCVVNTTAVTANSNIFITQADYLNTRLGVTCLTTATTGYDHVSAISVGTSFTITLGTFAANPACFVYSITN